MSNVKTIREYFYNELNEGRFTEDRLGGKTIEIIGASFIADEKAIFGKVNEEYVDQEINWYESQSTNINDIREGSPPAAWVYAANKHGEINSNYGYLINSPRFGNQFNNALRELIRNPDSRRAIMIYNRPSMWSEYNELGKNDFVCTNAVTYYIRDGKLHAVVQMRSNDVVYGYKNDRAWADYVLRKLVVEYNNTFADQTHPASSPFIEPGNIYWQVQNLHVYEKHFHLVDERWLKENV